MHANGQAIFATLGETCRYFGTDNITFTIGSEYPNEVLEPRKFITFSSAAIEIANSRIYGGIHFPTSGPAGLEIGVVVSHMTCKSKA